MSKSALIFGASGVSGWAFVNEILHDYPKKGIWSKVHALTNRPLKQSDSMWPKDDRLNIVSGIDLLEGTQEELETKISKIEGVADVTHVYYLAYKASVYLEQEYEDAEAMLRRAVTATDQICPKLEFVVLQTGVKNYGCHLLEARPSTAYMPLPLKETHPRLVAPYGYKLFYYAQQDWLTKFAKEKAWNWCDTRPDIIVGFVPNQNFFSLATSIGIFLSLFAEIEGKGATCTYPGEKGGYMAKSNDSSSYMIARQTLHLSLTLPNSRKGEAFNVADAKAFSTWETKWPEVCSYFGLNGTGPPASGEPTEVRTYIKNNIAVWKEMENKYGLKTGIADSDLTFQVFEYFLLSSFNFDRQIDLTKVYATGFEEERSTIQSWGGVFDLMKAAKVIPP